ncbi:YraN family protein [Brevundimonas sp. NPDC092305]|uniref:YraN family protein n=1 Tax=Brevundimonas sp. NPDC092305 TaxID=3363957 RepID=UPI0037F282B4
MTDRPATRLKAPKVVRAKRGWRVSLGGRSRQVGHASEWLAATLLMLKGYQILGFRLKTRAGEIDILARRRDVLAVIEVKRRKTLDLALCALTADQYERLLTAGRAVLRQRPSLAGHQLRIDIVALAPGRFPVHRRNVTPFGGRRGDPGRR